MRISWETAGGHAIQKDAHFRDDVTELRWC
jgi:hypothetical protein